ncbi:hypothetical protein AK812_SmicGene30621 [Symbiodinium microadriaticum]|uniref:Uncharacterized protein n=1 Tax=Symbiodinium microadriaticum TaxID=2951 RepID=A0A1Q9CYZ1_SYMMI|nr:hypothetical protein AK812_SmicGene30621 [Symbiodinium microadriaticum]
MGETLEERVESQPDDVSIDGVKLVTPTVELACVQVEEQLQGEQEDDLEKVRSELEELRAVPEGSSEWVEAKARLDAAVQAAVTAGCAQAELLEARAREAEAEAAAAGEELTGAAARKARKRRLEAEKLRAEATSERQRMARFGQAVRRAQSKADEIPSITVELEDDAEDVKETVIPKDTKTKTDTQVKKDKRAKKSSSGKGRRRKKEEVRRKAEEAARRWQERDDQLEASIRVVEQRGAKAAAEREAQRRAEKERQLRAAERRREAEAQLGRSISDSLNIQQESRSELPGHIAAMQWFD